MDKHSTTSPFTLVSRFDPQQQQLIDVDPAPTPRIPLFAEVYHSTPEKARANEAARLAAAQSTPALKAAPERGKVSAAATGKIKPPSKRTAKKPTTPAPEAPKTEAEILAYIDSLDTAEQERFFQLANIVRKYETPVADALSTDEQAMIASARKLPDGKRAALNDFVAGLARIEDRATEETPAATLDPEPEAEPTPEPADDQPTKREWFNMYYEPRAYNLIPHAIQVVSLLMAEDVFNFNDKVIWGDDWSEGYQRVLHTVAHAIDRVQRDTLITMYIAGVMSVRNQPPLID